MAESKTEHGPSLLPYLNSTHGGLYIDFPAIRTAGTFSTSGNDFIESTGPFAALYEGVVSAGVEGGHAKLFFLVQPDTYPPVSSELDPITNVQVEGLWQAALQRSLGLPARSFQPVLNEQLDDKGRLLQLRPMFYCAHQNRWCHPHCPHCGDPLNLCRDDQLLKDAGLPEYTCSIERFLYCSACAAQPDSAFFYALESSATVTEKLNDCSQLIEGFSRLLTKKDLAEELPCVGCSESTSCYGPETLVLERMKPVFFFPFHMLLMPASAINLKEFAALLSGWKRGDILKRLDQQSKRGRARLFQQMTLDVAPSEGLLFGGDERRFLEVLYLKLTLLKELCDLIPLDKDRISEPVGSMSLESVWVDLPMPSAHLPLFWNFSLRLVDPVGQPDSSPVDSPVPLGRKRHFLGAAWCYILLDGSGQGMAPIRTALHKLIQDSDLLEQAEAIDLEKVDTIFTPRHLTCDAIEEPLNPEWIAFWQRALLMGIKMFKAGVEADTTWPEETFQQELDLLRKEIRQTLFTAAPVLPITESAASTENDAAITAILKSIFKSWPSADVTPEEKTSFSSKLLKTEPSPSTSLDEDGDYIETVILGKAEAEEIQAQDIPETKPEIEETVIMRVEEKASDSLEAPPPLDATVVIQSDHAQRDASDWEDMDETVVLTAPQNGASPGDGLEETVVLGSPSAIESEGGKGEQKIEAQNVVPDGDDLEKTVMIQTPTAKDKEPKS